MYLLIPSCPATPQVPKTYRCHSQTLSLTLLCLNPSTLSTLASLISNSCTYSSIVWVHVFFLFFFSNFLPKDLYPAWLRTRNGRLPLVISFAINCRTTRSEALSHGALWLKWLCVSSRLLDLSVTMPLLLDWVRGEVRMEVIFNVRLKKITITHTVVLYKDVSHYT